MEKAKRNEKITNEGFVLAGHGYSDDGSDEVNRVDRKKKDNTKKAKNCEGSEWRDICSVLAAGLVW